MEMLSSLMMELYNWMFLICYSIGSSSMDWYQSWMCWELESHASHNDVFCNCHDKAEVPVAATSVCGGDDMCIGINLLGQ